MATGIPNISRSPEYSDQLKNISVKLEYEFKKDSADILNHNFEKSINNVPINVNSGFSDNKNKLFFGNNFDVLLELLYDYNLKKKVKLIYIDPPFATKSTFNSKDQEHAYSDILSGGQYIEFIRERLILLKELLSEEGSIYVHLDSNAAFHIKIIMDEIFGENNFRSFITRKKCSNKNSTTKTYGNISDYVLFYTKSNNYTWNRPYANWDEENIIKQYPFIEEETGKRYKRVPIHAPGTRNGLTGQEWRGMLPPKGKHWQYTPAKLDKLDESGEIYWSKNGNPRRKVYFEDSKGVSVQDIWLDFRDSINQNTRTTGYPTEKNIGLVDRIIQASSDEGDLVLDCFCGSGTTLESAFKNNRRWIGVDNSIEAIKAIRKRFGNGLEPHGDYVAKKQELKQQNFFNHFQCGFELLASDYYYNQLKDNNVVP